MKNLLRAFASLLVVVVVPLAKADVTHVGNAELLELIRQGIPVVDVRRLDEWQSTGVVDGSHLLTFFDKHGRYDAQKWLEEFNRIAPRGTPVVLICARGVRSRNIADLLDARLGYTDIHNVERGILHWIKKGEPVVPYKPTR